MALCKPALNDYFVAIFQISRNRLKFGISTLCVLKNVPVVLFFKNAETSGRDCVKFNPPPPLSVSKQRRISIFEGQNNVHVSFTLLEGDWGGGGGGGGELSRMCLKPCFPACGKKTQGHCLTQKELTCQISADSEQLWKSLWNSHLGLACTKPFNCNTGLFKGLTPCAFERGALLACSEPFRSNQTSSSRGLSWLSLVLNLRLDEKALA